MPPAFQAVGQLPKTAHGYKQQAQGRGIAGEALKDGIQLFEAQPKAPGQGSGDVGSSIFGIGQAGAAR